MTRVSLIPLNSRWRTRRRIISQQWEIRQLIEAVEGKQLLSNKAILFVSLVKVMLESFVG